MSYGGKALSAQFALRVQELLGDGKWHDYERVVRELVKLVPPGVALRHNEALLAASRARHARLRETKGGLAQPYKSHRPPSPPEQQIRAGARDIVRSFLRNDRLFETNRPGMPANTPEARAANRLRKVRLIGTPNALKGDPLRMLRDRLEYENTMMRDQLKAVRAYLIEIGHEEAADRLAPE